MKAILKITGLVSMAIFLNFGYSYSDNLLTGEVGVDLTNHTYNETLKDENKDLHINRSQSNHYLKLLTSGVIKNNKFASYSLSGELNGIYLNTETSDSRKSLYLKPTLQSFSAQLSFFPLRPYRLTTFLEKSSRKTIKYEANISSVDIPNPELEIVRRYEAESFARGVNFNYAISKNTSIVSRFSNTYIKNVRNFDFNENLDLSVEITERFSDPAAPIKILNIENSLADNTILIYIDHSFIDSIAPGDRIYIEINEGGHLVEILSSKYNAFTRQLNVQNDISFKVAYLPLPGTSDAEQKSNTISTALKIKKKLFENDFRFSYSSANIPIQNLTSSIGNITNKHSLDISKNMLLKLETSYNKNSSVLDTLSSQASSVFHNKVAFNYGKEGGISTAFIHLYSKNNTSSDDLKTAKTDQLFSNNIGFPLENYSSLFSLSNSLGRLSDNSGYSKDSYNTAFNGDTNLRLEYGILELAPKNKLQLSLSKEVEKQIKTNILSKQIRNETSLDGNVKELSALGSLDFHSQFQYTKVFRNGVTTVNKLYSADIKIARDFWRDNQISIQTSQKKQTTGGSSPTPGANEDQKSLGRESEITSTYGMSLRLKPTSSLNISFDISSLKQNQVNISNLNLSITATVPYVNLPISSKLMKRSNKMEGLPTRTELTIENKMRYHFRQISIEFTHNYKSENRLNGNYGYHEFFGKLSRKFGIL